MNLSTSTRLTLVAVLAILTCMPLAGWLIATTYKRSLLAGFDSRLEAYANVIAGSIETRTDGQLEFPGTLRDLRFDQVFSGWYWQIRRQDQVLASSRSLWDSSLQYAAAPEDAPAQRSFNLRGPRQERLRGVELRLHLGPQATPLDLIVTLPRSEVDIEFAAFRRTLVIALGSLALMLALVFALQIRWGLKPLRRMEHSLQRVRSGASVRVSDDLPGDLRQVAEVMNEVLSHQEQLIERGRSTAGNLAHALKTPLATLRLGLAQPQVDGPHLDAALDQLQGIVDHHLARAAAAGRAGGIYHRTRLQEAAEPVLEAVRALHRSRPVQLDVHFDGDPEVPIDAQDLQELIGNLLDNAMQWARQRVQLRCLSNHGGATVRLQVDDDGPGIPPEARAEAMARGTQLDEASQGSGLGLAIVRDIAALYRIDFALDESPAGGLRVRLELPRATG